MKKLLFSVILLAGLSATAQVKVGDNPTTINSSALLEMESTSKGLLMSRMTTAQRTAIASPANGLQVFDTDTKSFWHYDGTIWVESSNSSNSKWIDGSNAGEIVLNNPTGVDSVKYTNNNGLITKSKDGYWVQTTSDTNPSPNYATTYNNNFIKASNISENGGGTLVNTHTYNTYSLGVDPAYPGAKIITNLAPSISVDYNNSNNYTAMYVGQNAFRHNGSGNAGNIAGLYNHLLTSEQGTFSEMRGVQTDFVALGNTQDIGNFTGSINSLSIRGSVGKINSYTGFNATLSSNATNSSAVLTTFRGMWLRAALTAQYTGTIGSAEFIRISPSYGGASVTNEYGIYIENINKGTSNKYALYTNSGWNRFGDNVGIGTVYSTSRLNVDQTADNSDVLSLRRTSTQYSSFRFDSGGNQYVGFSPTNNAKRLIYNSTTDSSNTAPTIGNNGHSFQIRGTEMFHVNDNYGIRIGNTALVNTEISYFNASKNSEISNLIGTITAKGSLIQGDGNANIVIGLRDSDNDDSFAVVSGGNNFHTDGVYDKLISVFKANGRVGIGVANPTTTLDVAGKIKVGDDTTTATKGTIRFNSTTNKFQGFVDVANDTSDGTADGWVDLH